jgi:hypothetical protein
MHGERTQLFVRDDDRVLSKRKIVLCVGLIGCAAYVAALQANEAQDFWREEALRRSSTPAQASAPATHVDPASAVRHQLKVAIRPRRERQASSGDDHRAASGSRYCVRTCDGYYFPLSSRGAVGQDAEACQASCPGAPMEVFTRADDDGIEDATSIKGKSYSELPASLSYRTQLTQACSCKIEKKRGFAALLEDATLVRGDIVVTEKGVYVFVGGNKFPYRESDFVPLNEVRGLSRKVMTYLADIDRLAR